MLWVVLALLLIAILGCRVSYLIGETVGREREQDRAFRAWHRERDTNAEIRSLWPLGE